MTKELREEIRRLSQDVAMNIGRMLGQEYRLHDGRWHLYSLGQRQDALSDDEVQWHIDRNHAPFIDGGVTTDDPRWWDEPGAAR
jgi:hypothetical protein